MESHCLQFPDLKLNTKSLKCKFEALYNHKKPAGDPNCPVSVRKAKRQHDADVYDGDVGRPEGW
jgi:hypothetical protein